MFYVSAHQRAPAAEYIFNNQVKIIFSLNVNLLIQGFIQHVDIQRDQDSRDRGYTRLYNMDVSWGFNLQVDRPTLFFQPVTPS